MELFLPVYTRNWNSTTRNQHVFKQKYADFMQKTFKVSFSSICNRQESKSNILNSIPGNKRFGRPKSTFENSSDRTKRRRIQQLRNFKEQIAQANALNNKIQPVSAVKKEVPNNINGSLAMYMDLGLSRTQYETLRKYNLHLFEAKSYPPYDKIRSAKENCYPENINISEYGTSVKLQSLLDHTARRIIESLPTSELNIKNGDTFVLYGKWGMDGASGQQTFKQNWTSNNLETVEDLSSEEISDKSVFMISFVPLQIISEDKIMWVNDRPSSVRYCRPIKFTFKKETPSTILQEYNYYTEEINNLIPTVVTINEISFTITYNLHHN